MGMYTEIRTEFIVSDPAVKTLLTGMMITSSTRDSLLDLLEEPWAKHPFFQCDRWAFIFTMGSAYFDTYYREAIYLGDDRMLVRTCANLKNYVGEISKFVDWIRPYCEPQSAPIVTEQYEADDVLTKHFQDGSKAFGPANPRH